MNSKHHICKESIPCDFAIETPEGNLVCSYTGKQFGLFLLSKEDDEDGEDNVIDKDDENEEEDKITENLKETILFTLNQLINNYDFPFEAYADELVRLHKEYDMRDITPLEFTISTLFIMSDGDFGELCNTPNMIVKGALVKLSELKELHFSKHLITSGKTKWCEKIGQNNDEEEDDEDAFTSFSRKKRALRITIRGHAEIMEAYNKIHKKDNDFFFIL
jgi:hypothetical protein